MASTETTSSSKKLRVLLIPFFASSHIGPFTELAVSLATARPHAVEATVAVTPANASIVRSLLQRHENGGTPVKETLIRAQSPDAVVTDVHFMWNAGVCDELGVPCVTFNVVGAFSTLAMRHLTLALVSNSNTNIEPEPEAVSVPRFPAPEIRVPTVELPEYLRSQERVDYSTYNRLYEVQGDCFGLAVNTSPALEEHYRGILAHVSDAQLDELALGLEASGVTFLWVVRTDRWSPPERWHERVGGRGMVATAWAPQRAILRHRAVGAFVTHCGWNSVLETVAAGVPVLTWPIVFEQFITERLLTEVLGIGERLWPAGAGVRSTRYEEKEVVPAEDVARALKTFMRPGGLGDAARSRVMDLAAKVHAAVAEGGSSDRDLHRLIDDLMEAAAAGRTTI
uniref:Cytokinin-O-glucosyltransferase 1 n=1 Tax=Aegilops tauschii TaxID=37682 RepID=M8CF97_AEGTA